MLNPQDHPDHNGGKATVCLTFITTAADGRSARPAVVGDQFRVVPLDSVLSSQRMVNACFLCQSRVPFLESLAEGVAVPLPPTPRDAAPHGSLNAAQHHAKQAVLAKCTEAAGTGGVYLLQVCANVDWVAASPRGRLQFFDHETGAHAVGEGGW